MFVLAENICYLRSLEREEYNICRVYRADKEDCQSCAMSSRCLSAQAQKRTLRVNIFEEAVKKCREGKGQRCIPIS